MGDLRESMQKKVSGRRVHTSGESVLATLMKIYHGNRSFRLNIVVSTVSALTKKHNVFSFFFLDIVQDFVFELPLSTYNTMVLPCVCVFCNKTFDHDDHRFPQRTKSTMFCRYSLAFFEVL